MAKLLANTGATTVANSATINADNTTHLQFTDGAVIFKANKDSEAINATIKILGADAPRDNFAGALRLDVEDLMSQECFTDLLDSARELGRIWNKTDTVNRIGWFWNVEQDGKQGTVSLVLRFPATKSIYNLYMREGRYSKIFLNENQTDINPDMLDRSLSINVYDQR